MLLDECINFKKSGLYNLSKKIEKDFEYARSTYEEANILLLRRFISLI
jgi:hypothetical protein